jgi:glycosyltransferase involved in cell wall biosynthesis
VSAPARVRQPLVTAIVSTYAAERYMRGCLEDLLAQTIADRIEILVIDACSPQNEGAIVRQFQQSHQNIRYLRTEVREYSSRVFNRAVAMARGKYLTTANTDDRHRPDFFARMVAVLEAMPQTGIVYADSLITRRDNETFAQNTASRRYAWPDYTHTAALSCCLFGAQPLWRRSAHLKAGLFDEQHPRANDQDMFLRIAMAHGAVHLKETLGLFLARADSVSGADHQSETLADVLTVMRHHRTATPLPQLFPALGGIMGTAGEGLATAAALIEMGNLCVLGPYTDAHLALDFFRRAVDQPLGADVATVRRIFANNCACVLAAAGATDKAVRALSLCHSLPAASDNLARVQAAAQRRAVPRLRELAFASLPHAVVSASRHARGLVLGDGGVPTWTAEREQLPWDVYGGPNGVPVTPAERTFVMPQQSAPASSPANAAPSAVPPAPQERRNVLLVMYGWADSGGGTILPRSVAKDLAGRGHRVSVFHAVAQEQPQLPAYGLRRGHEDGVDLYGLCNRPSAFMDLAAPLREVDDPAVRAAFAGVLDAVGPDVVHFYNLHNLGMSLPAECKARGIPTVLSSNNYWPICPRLYLASERLERCSGPSDDGSKCERCLGQAGTAAAHAGRKRAARRMLDAHIDVHLAVSQRVRQLFVDNGADPAHLRVLLQQPPSVDEIWSRTGSKRAIVAKLDRPLRVGYLGSVMPHKGVHVLAQALQALPLGSIAAVAIGDVQADYRAHLQKLDRNKTLHFFGGYAQAQIAELLAAVDVVVVPSVWDDCAPLVVREALAARAPVLGSRIGGIPDFIAHGENGLLFTAGDPVGLARALAAFLQDRTLLGRMQQSIAAPAGFGAYVDDVLAVYGELWAARAVAAPQVIADTGLRDPSAVPHG